MVLLYRSSIHIVLDGVVFKMGPRKEDGRGFGLGIVGSEWTGFNPYPMTTHLSIT